MKAVRGIRAFWFDRQDNFFQMLLILFFTVCSLHVPVSVPAYIGKCEEFVILSQIERIVKCVRNMWNKV